MKYPSIIASQFANYIIYSSGLKETLLNSLKVACRAGFWKALDFPYITQLCKAGKKAGEGVGTGESQENTRLFSLESVLRSVLYATHRTFYYPYATLRSLSYKIKDYRQVCLVSPILATTQVSVYMAKKKTNQTNKSHQYFVVVFFKGSIRKVLHVNIFCFIDRFNSPFV